MQDSGYRSLLQKLDVFIRKYYKNLIIKGFLYTLALFIASFLIITLLEYLGHFNSAIRTFLFWVFIASNSYVSIRYIIMPVFRLLKIGKTINHEQASRIIGQFFPEVQDKLLNTIQLQASAEQEKDNSLIAASIEQRIQLLRPVPFNAAIDFKKNRKYLKYLLPPLSLFLILLLSAPSVIKEPTDRLIRHDEEIVEKAPFEISLLNQSLTVQEHGDFELLVGVKGELIPEKIYLRINNTEFRLDKKSNISFSYVIRNVRENQRFSFLADGFQTEVFELKVIPTPTVRRFDVAVEYPSYIKQKNETFENLGDLIVPEGTKIIWDFQTLQTSAFWFSIDDDTQTVQAEEKGHFVYKHTAKKDFNYRVSLGNDQVVDSLHLSYLVQVVPDLFPQIAVEEQQDSLSYQHLYFSGQVKDDYGLQKLAFVYWQSDSPDKKKSIPIPLDKNQLTSRFFYQWNIGADSLATGQSLSYYFQVWDNDGVNGSKSSKTFIRSYKTPSADELADLLEEEGKDIKDDLESSLKEARELQKEIDRLHKEMLNKEALNWQDKQKIEALIEKQKTLQNKVEALQQKNEAKDKKQGELQENNERLQQKQAQIQDLFDQVMSEEMKEMMEELERLMEEMDKEQIQEQLEKMNFSNEDLEKELDRALEQFKQLEWEMKMEKTQEKLAELAEKQKELAEKTKEEGADTEAIKKEQEAIDEAFQQIKEDLKSLEKLNDALENKNTMPEIENAENQVQEALDKSKEELEKGKQSKASESQQDAGEKMEEMANDMADSMESNSEEKAGEDMEALRALLENIITLSFDQEALITSLNDISPNDPKYVNITQSQKKLKDDAKMVEDSLFALSKRVAQLQPIVNREIGLVNENMSAALQQMSERNTSNTTKHQQYVMTSFNNLALILDEALKAMQEEESSGKPGSGNCEKPGGKGAKPSAGDIKKMQQALSKQLEDMKGKMGKEGNKGENKSGKNPMSKELAKMAAQQAAIRQLTEQLGQQLNEDGSGNGNEFKKIAKEMEALEKEIVNQNIDHQTMLRQQEIMSRLLKAENAERERGEEERRKSKEAENYGISNPEKYSDYQKQKEQEQELLKTIPPGLKPYYRERVNDYFNKLDAE